MDENRVEGFARTVGGKAESMVGSMTGDTKSRIDGAVDQVAGRAQRAFGKAKDTVQDMTGDYGSGLLDQVEEYGDMLADKVDERPIVAVLIAAGVGFLLALAFRPTSQVVYRRR